LDFQEMRVNPAGRDAICGIVYELPLRTSKILPDSRRMPVPRAQIRMAGAFALMGVFKTRQRELPIMPGLKRMQTIFSLPGALWSSTRYLP
jgi:hypothetical protein